MGKVKDLLIPRKSSNKPTDLDTDWRAIEIWAKQVVANLGGFYASLTGPGETTTPGALTQQGGFDVQGGATGAITLTSGTLVDISGGSSDGSGVDISGVGPLGTNTSPVTISSAANGNVTITSAQAKVILQTTNSPSSITLNGAALGGGSIDIDATNYISLQGAQLDIGGGSSAIGFFGATPVTLQSSIGVTTVAQVVTILKNYGLLS